MEADTEERAAAPPNLVRLAVATIIAGAPWLGAPRCAGQTAAAAGKLEEVTGYRLAHSAPGFRVPSPIVTVGTEQLEQTSNVALEASLNKLPQFVPALQFVTGESSRTPRTRRARRRSTCAAWAPTATSCCSMGGAPAGNASLVVDLNTIPSRPSSAWKSSPAAPRPRTAPTPWAASSTSSSRGISRAWISMRSTAETEAGDGKEYGSPASWAATRRRPGNIMLGAEYTSSLTRWSRSASSSACAGGSDGERHGLLVDRDQLRPDGDEYPESRRPSTRCSRTSGRRQHPGAQHFFLNDDGTLYSRQRSAFRRAHAPTAADPSLPGGTYRYKGADRRRVPQANCEGSVQNDTNAYRSDAAEPILFRPRRLAVQRFGVVVPAGSPLAEPCRDPFAVLSRARRMGAQIPHGTGRNCHRSVSRAASARIPIRCRQTSPPLARGQCTDQCGLSHRRHSRSHLPDGRRMHERSGIPGSNGTRDPSQQSPDGQCPVGAQRNIRLASPDAAPATT